MIIKEIDWLKNAYVALIRLSFGDPASPADYKYNADVKLNKIAIYRGFPRRIEFFPCIVIEANPSDCSMTQLGEEQNKENRDADGNLISVKYFGGITVPLNLTIKARTVTDRDRLTDLTSVYIRYLFRNVFARYGFAYTKIKLSSDEQEEVEQEPVFSRTVTVDHYTEFEAEIPGSLFTMIDKINLDIIVQSTDITQ